MTIPRKENEQAGPVTESTPQPSQPVKTEASDPKGLGHLDLKPAETEAETKPDTAKASEPEKITAVFVYGTLQLPEVLAWVSTGSYLNHPDFKDRYTKATLTGYKRVSVEGADYPACIVGEPTDKIDGHVIYPKYSSEWKKLDLFEGKLYKRIEVEVEIDEGGAKKMIKAFVYLWDQDMDMLEMDQEWSLEDFRENKLADWKALFWGKKLGY
ncbi:hypothetical protein BJ508DRAFT_361397 [Ascobolus immersus RN42]|uniref:Putative gamma-glutamylcyclotransferase n=1 Tax=Ascobolus immersus RN42 TaxID=1160509 RepID=A0A3N4I9T9_ASCIM|nr:hypothetical protein BJ508DRAFT_361397 [Ascobolus immersus RN42]